MLISNTKLLVLDSTLNVIRIVDSDTGNIDSEYNFANITSIIDVAIDYTNKKVWTLSTDGKINRFGFNENDNVVTINREATITVNFLNNATYYAGKSLAINEETGDLFYLYKPNGTMVLYKIPMTQAHGSSVTTGGVNISRPSSSFTGAIILNNPDDKKLYIFHSFSRSYDISPNMQIFDGYRYYYIIETSNPNITHNLTIVSYDLVSVLNDFYQVPFEQYIVNYDYSNVLMPNTISGFRVYTNTYNSQYIFDTVTTYSILTTFNTSFYNPLKKCFVVYFDSIYTSKHFNSLTSYSCIFEISPNQSNQKNKVIYSTTTNDSRNLVSLISTKNNYFVVSQDYTNIYKYNLIGKLVQFKLPLVLTNTTSSRFMKCDPYKTVVYMFQNNFIVKRNSDFYTLSSIPYTNNIHQYFVLPSNNDLKIFYKLIKKNKDNIIFRLYRSNKKWKIKLYLSLSMYDNTNFIYVPNNQYLLNINNFKYAYLNYTPDILDDSWIKSTNDVIETKNDTDTYIMIDLKKVYQDNNYSSSQKMYIYLMTTPHEE